MATFRMSNCDLVTFRMSNGNLQDDNLDHLLCCDFSHSLTNPMPATRKRYPLGLIHHLQRLRLDDTVGANTAPFAVLIVDSCHLASLV